VLRFLVKSKARRRLLALLWEQDVRGSVSELAERAGVAFAAAHRELREMRQYGLVRVERDGARDVYFADRNHPDAELLEQLLRRAAQPTRTGSVDETDAAVKSWLKNLGAPLRLRGDAEPPSLAEALVAGVRLARRDPVVARALPIVFWRHRDELDVAALSDLVSRADEKHALAFFLELTGELGGDRRLTGLAEAFRDRRVTSQRDFFLLSPSRSRRQASERTPAAAAKWGFRMNMDYEAFQALFDEFSG
jgi:DNA-binding MarR family transcriptional regulator